MNAPIIKVNGSSLLGAEGFESPNHDCSTHLVQGAKPNIYRVIAQLVEQAAHNGSVSGSSPHNPTNVVIQLTR